MAASLLEYAPAEFSDVLQGLATIGHDDGLADADTRARTFAMANFIYAAVDQRSSEWTDYTSASSPYLPATPSSHSLAGPDAHIPTYILEHDGIFPDDRLAEAVRRALPAVPDLYARPSQSLPEMGIWSCLQCGATIDPWNLTMDERALIATYMGGGLDSVMITSTDGRVQLDSGNPWQFMRSVDCLAWTHLGEHLRSQCISFWFPSPSSAYKSSPGLWWDETRLNARQVYKPMRLELYALERAGRHRLRMWKARKMVIFAKKGLHAARYHLTQWRRRAAAARETLVREMFEAGRGIVETGFALVAQMDGEQVDPERMDLEAARDEHRAQRREWERRKEEWIHMHIN